MRSIKIVSVRSTWTRADQINQDRLCEVNLDQSGSDQWQTEPRSPARPIVMQLLTILTKSVHIPSSFYPLSPCRYITGSLVIGGSPAGLAGSYANAIPIPEV
jgi:hypothetical protein